ncbi:type II toxin-antitoxin system HicA family toxin [Campylobacter fetus]|uniref:type II toxin-antitoxin system HicA family toxin n=1 Tax=Campylobacter fetus TaxID=196 RepID=UPI0011C9F665|nr:type II toxin-antitoxin system HicA family toxin [Campylobacter fetus]EAJ1232618.1 type II toxin-antitoxin system HicA family toxin [Campylobacter fetus]EAK0414703.1 type II toxin-antitoxin system HicA family toxin [Campylobacter fetus]TXF09181.1 type II toxin-antitoxin system HicA family toxin [Campylobacter fetus subsp. fetus]
MSKKDKLLKELQNNPANVRFEILEKILKDSGFELKSIKGSHHQFSDGKTLITLPYHKPMKIFYVKLVLNILKDIK